MDSERPQHVSVIAPISPAIEQVRLMLFRPFDLYKWLIVGFCAWLSYLGQGGGPVLDFRFGGHQQMPSVHTIKSALIENLPWIIIAAGIFIPIGIILWLTFCWLSSRGKFMFVHCVAGNKAEAVVPWKKFAGHSNSLFLFRIIFGLAAVAAIVLLLVPGVIAAIVLQHSEMINVAAPGLLLAIFIVIVAAIVIALVIKFTNDFVVPIMFLQTASCLAGWRTFLALLGSNKLRFVLYILFCFVISLVIIFIILTVCLIGCCCCCASVLLFVPYIGTVLLLPLFVFIRSYSLFYLRQFGTQFDVFSLQTS
jgi:hypothetical protein